MDWPKFWSENSKLLRKTWGLESVFAEKVTFLLFALSYYDIPWTVTSGLRSASKQRELIDRWNAGDPGIVAPPSTSSLHLSGLAVDISCPRPDTMGYFARWFGLRWGGDFSRYDPVHIDFGT